MPKKKKTVAKKKSSPKKKQASKKSTPKAAPKSAKQLNESKEQSQEIKDPVIVEFTKDRMLTENSDAARDLYNQSRYGVIVDSGQVQLSLLETLYLCDKKKIKVVDAKNKEITFEKLLAKARKLEPNVWIRYCVFKDIRNKGYIIKTALKFGADFRIYDRGVKPGEDHARWVVFPVHETSSLTWYEFSAKNRVAHSTKKRLLLAVVDDEKSCTYYETRWLRP